MKAPMNFYGTCANPECQLCKPLRTSVGEAVTVPPTEIELDRDSWRHECERITMQRDLWALECQRHKAARETLRQACAELESDLDVMEKERDEARREAERRQDFIEHVLRGNPLGEREGPTGCGDSPTADVPTGVESGPVVPPRGYANRNGTSASEEPYNGARDGKMPPPNVYVTEWPTATDAPVTRAEFAALDARVVKLGAASITWERGTRSTTRRSQNCATSRWRWRTYAGRSIPRSVPRRRRPALSRRRC
jgi:hypothetical protein